MDDLEKNVLLLAIYKKEEDESILDVVKKLANGGVFELKIGKKLLSELESEQAIIDGVLSFAGQMRAKSAEAMFRL